MMIFKTADGQTRRFMGVPDDLSVLARIVQTIKQPQLKPYTP